PSETYTLPLHAALPIYCVVNIKTTDTLNVRSKPKASAKVVGQFDYAECGIVVVDECVGSWCPIEDGHIGGWVNSKYLSMVSPARSEEHTSELQSRENLV